ncbi:MAG: putative WD domain, G-beta repeat protein [Streblomastix strix]|uniref:Putative WD domain, G-beta repeat protein n=1 Tax=Streblomastix strix TaxID=222440 RepID=A0A5J4W4A3_9EUKA|nr:MAG: putative WD domain, G-beta repeat protein [Streblomastix strix]
MDDLHDYTRGRGPRVRSQLSQFSRGTRENVPVHATKKRVERKTIDFNAPILNMLESVIPLGTAQDESICACTRYVHSSVNENKCPVLCISWTPDARHILTGSSSGELTLWNGLTFNFETLVQSKS